MTSISRLKKEHNFKYFGNTCSNCSHHKHEERYKFVEGVEADSCMLYRDEPFGSPVLLPSTNGVCDAHQRIPTRNMYE